MPKGFLVKRHCEIAVPSYRASGGCFLAGTMANGAYRSFVAPSPLRSALVGEPSHGELWCAAREGAQPLGKTSAAERALGLLSMSTGWLTPPAENLSAETVVRSKAYDDGSGGRRRRQQARGRRKTKAMRKINFDHEPPVSGIIIKSNRKRHAETLVTGDIDSKYNVVEVTEEAKAKLANIENRIGSFVCKLCDNLFADAFRFAQHRCPSIIYVEYKCPECGKAFNCPANLASHRRWHKPRRHETPPESPTSAPSPGSTTDSSSGGEGNRCPGDAEAASDSTSTDPSMCGSLRCRQCGTVFKKLSSLGRHILAFHSDDGS